MAIGFPTDCSAVDRCIFPRLPAAPGTAKSLSKVDDQRDNDMGVPVYYF